MTPLLTLEEAWERLFALARPLDAETVAVDTALGRYLAADLLARRTQPSRDLSAMDGFAVAGPGPWRIIGEARAGADFAGSLRAGEAIRISTGAASPEGTGGIVMVEDGVVAADRLTSTVAPNPGHIRRRGFDFMENAVLLGKGTRIGAPQLALTRAAGHGELAVAQLPRLAVIECGDELVANPGDCPPDRLPASNGAMVAAMAAEAGAVVQRIGPLLDDRDALARAFADAGEADVIVTTAGASVGAHDHVDGALEDWGAELAFWRVAIRPGKPLLVAQRGAQLVLGLPGNPVSAFTTAYLFLLPLLRALQGSVRPQPAAIPIPLGEAIEAGGERREFRRARLVDGTAHPLPERDSSALRTLAEAALLIDRPAHARAAKVGDSVPCYWIGIG